ncbi:uncharacterized protein LOC114963310 isoform X4 [Acropora millepora]|uniref:uncharacterized protein LOC114963310 isoform X4 n=1 Tax=Acropora millepora TaxID=45264 RepID=UPI001CF11FBE|nr:uncharacterized protein LOC114963310 isoform X4 [Acropora millepora]
MSQDHVSEQADAVQTSQGHVLNITLLASEWKTSEGGLSTFNRELAIHLAQIQNVRVSLFVPEGACNDEDKREARSFSISILDAGRCFGVDPLVWLTNPPQDHKIDVIVGHGVKLGFQIQFIRKHEQFQNCKWVHVIHTAPEDLSKYKGYKSPISRGETKHWDEVNLCKCADLVVPVGPRLAKAYRSYLQECKKGDDFFELIPGPFEREFVDLPAKQNPKKENDDFIVLLCGRGDEEDFELKGYDIAVKAFADQRLKGKHYSLLFVGSPEGKQDEVRERFLKYGITCEQLRVREFVNSRKRMKELFCEVDMIIMPSKSEGFGLVALEALSAGLPILVGSNSGFASVIEKLLLGQSSIVADSVNPVRWAAAIENVCGRHELALGESKILKENYSKKYCWKTQCEELVDRLWKIVFGTSAAQSQAIAADDLVKQCPSAVPEAVCQPNPATMQQHIEKDAVSSTRGEEGTSEDELTLPELAGEAECTTLSSQKGRLDRGTGMTGMATAADNDELPVKQANTDWIIGIEKPKRDLRLARLLIGEGTNVLKQFFLFSIHPETLENTLKKNSTKLAQLKSKRVICDDDWEMLFPASGDPPNADKFEITLLHLLIREFSNLPTPAKGWHKLPDKTDDSIQADIARINCFKNELSHRFCTSISESEFKEKWRQISSPLERILVYIHKQNIQFIKNDAIDDNMGQILGDIIKKWQKSLDQQETEFIYERSSCLPDQMSEESVYGRSNEIALIKDNVENDGVAVVLITGGPGFGKTTVARMAAQKLKEDGQTVLFCSLQGKKTFDEVATEMILSCRKEPGQLPDSLEYWLKNWSKQISRQPTVLVLDNADGIIESEADQASFLGTLSTMRMLSGNNLTFLITSRTRLRDVKSWMEVKLNPLSNEDAKRVLKSCVNNKERKSNLQSPDLDTIAKLCSCVPLALSIVGSLLSDYPGEMLIEHLEKEPMDILEGDSESFRRAIANSFDFLGNAEQDALVALSVFPGSFDCKAARAVFQDCSGSLPIKILRSLNIRSLLEEVSALRYKLHPLVRDFGKTIGKTKSPQILQNSEQLACVHFLSRLEENARMLYWRKDKCRESIESFGEDRHNYEFCLQNVADHEISSCQPFLNNFAQTCMYLEKCFASDSYQNVADEEISSCQPFLKNVTRTGQYLEKCFAPNSYLQFLKRLLACKSFEAQTHPVLRVELLCLLSQEMRRVEEKEKYQEFMEEADGLFSEYAEDFTTNALPHVFYLHSRARFVSEKNKPYGLEAKELYDEALEICEKEIPNHPEKALNLLFAGRNAKRRKANEEANEKLKNALSMLRNLLGDHFMTALCLKDLADFYFFTASIGEELEKALNYYKEAMEVMEKLGTRNQKESILTLKNYGICHERKGNFEEAERLLLEANLVCDSEIEGDHKWKVIVKTALAVFYHEIASRQETEDDREDLLCKMGEFMKEGLAMCYRLNDNKKSISGLGNRKQIFKVLNKYPGRFERETYYPDEPL